MGAVSGAVSLCNSLSPRQLLTKLVGASDHLPANQRSFFHGPENCKVQQKDTFCHLNAVPPFQLVAPPGNLPCSVLLWVQDDPELSGDSSSSSPGAFPMDSFSHYFTQLLTGSGPWRKSCNTAQRFCPFAVFPAKSSFPGLWAVAKLCSCNLSGRAASSTRTEAHTLQLISHLSVWGMSVLYLCCPCTQAWDQASTPAHLDVFSSHGWEQLGRIFSASLWGFFST